MHRAADSINSITPTRAVIVLLHIASRFYLNPAAVWVLHTFGPKALLASPTESCIRVV